MIPETGGRRPGVPVLWALPLGMLAGAVTAALADVVSRAVLLDLIAWWPVWFVLGAAAFRARGRYLGLLRLSGLVPLVASVATVFFLLAHVQGWALMPSASGRLVGPESSYTRASLTVEGDHWLRVDGDAEFVYELMPVRWGGEVGLPVGVERSVEDSIAVSLRAPEDPGLQSFRGWDISLSPGPSWDLDLDGVLEVDLSALRLTRLVVAGSGSVILGNPAKAVEMSVSGDLFISVPAGAPVRVFGEASVPAGWDRLSDGWTSPGNGPGWLIAVDEGSTVTIAAQG